MIDWTKYCLISALSTVSGICCAQVDPWNFAGQFPQLRGLSGLPGGGFGVTSKGDPSINGALAISTPIGFSLGNGVWDFGASSRSVDNRPEFFLSSTPGDQTSSGTGQFMAGLRTPIGNITGCWEVLSRRLDGIANFQLQLPLNWKQGGVSFGVQNASNRPEAASQGVVGENGLSRSVYGVATYEFLHNDYISVGKGDVRFKGVFGSVSALTIERLRAVAEYDTFGWNTGLAYSMGTIPNLGDRFLKNETTIWAGFIDMHRATFSINFAF